MPTASFRAASPPVRIRRALPHEAEAIAGVHIAAWLTTYPGILPDDVIARRTDRATRVALWEARLASNDGVVAVAEDGTSICAIASACPLPGALPYGRLPLDGFAAYLEALYALETYRGRGIGLQLLGWIAGELANGGRTSLAFHVHARNRARAFYERAGARFIRDEPPEEPAATWYTCAYGWDDTAVLRGGRIA